VGGLAIVLRSAIYGIAAVVHEKFDPVAINQAIDADGVTIVSVVSTMLQRMLDERNSVPYPPSLRCILLGGGPAPRPLLERCAAINAPTVQTYGLTETASQIATLPPEDALRKLGSAGKPLPGAELRIEAEGRDMGPHDAGEIVVRGPMVTRGYLDGNMQGASTLKDGWLHTGDIGYLDEEGYLYVLDRRHDLIISGGENIYPAEVEAVLLDHPAVADAGVTGVSDAEWGQVVLAVVKLKPGNLVTSDDLTRFCRDRLAGYKIPREIRFVDAFPRNAAGKLVRAKLRE
jgi:O-succinylbenzoic acid--CoA ligase